MKTTDKNLLSHWLKLLDGTFNDGEIIELPVLTGSMMPCILTGKKIRINCLKEPELNVGDIIVYRDGKEITSHRLIVKINFFKRTYLYQKGDACRFGKWIDKRQVVGIVNSAQDRSGNYISFITPDEKKEGKELALRHLNRTLLEYMLIIPKRIKRWFLG